MDTTKELAQSIASEKRQKRPNHHTLGNFAGNLFSGVQVWPRRGYEPNSGPVSLQDYWDTFAKHHEEMPICMATNGTFLHVYEDGGTDPELHLFSVSLRTTTEEPA